MESLGPTVSKSEVSRICRGGEGEVVYQDGNALDDALPSRLPAVLATIRTERNMQHARAWKGYAIAGAAARRAPEPEPEPEAPPAAVPVPA